MAASASAARNWACLRRHRRLPHQARRRKRRCSCNPAKPAGVFRTHENAPRVLIANSNLVPHWATWEHFSALDRLGLMMYGQMTAGSWIYIGSQGIVQGTYETFVEIGRKHFNTFPGRQMDSHRRPRRHGWRATARRHPGRRLHARRRGAGAAASKNGWRPAISMPARRNARRRHGHDRMQRLQIRCRKIHRPARQRCRNFPTKF